MNKKWFITIAVFLLLSLFVSAYAIAPGIKANFPDIGIGNLEDNTGSFYDRHFYQFPNALDLNDFVIDWDTPKDNLKWTFMEADANNLITINDKVQLGAGDDPLNPPADKVINTTGTLASFRDIQASPYAEDPGPYTGPLTQNRVITLFVTDGVNLDSKTIQISSTQNSFDQTISTQIESTDKFEFTSPDPNELGWRYLALTGSASGALSALGLATTIDPSEVYEVGLWTSPIEEDWSIDPAQNKLYIAKYYMQTDQGMLDQVPDFRLRWGTWGQEQCTTLQFVSTGDMVNTLASDAAKTFKIYFEPLLTSKLYLAFDTLGRVGTFGSIFLSQVDVTNIDIPSNGTNLVSYEAGQFDNWVNSAQLPKLNAPIFERTEGGTLAISTGTTDTELFGFWQSPTDQMDYLPEKLYKVTFGLKTDDNPTSIPEIRLRAQAEDNQFTATYELYPSNTFAIAGQGMPDAEGKTYNLWFETPTVADNPEATEDQFFAAFDMLDINELLGGKVELNKVDVSYFNQPNF